MMKTTLNDVLLFLGTMYSTVWWLRERIHVNSEIRPLPRKVVTLKKKNNSFRCRKMSSHATCYAKTVGLLPACQKQGKSTTHPLPGPISIFCHNTWQMDQ